jgi:TolA-binding protein
MANTEASTAQSKAAPSPSETGGSRASWRDAWPIPAMGLGLVGLIGAAVVAFKRAPEADHNPLFHAAERLIASEKYGEAIAALNTEVLPVYAKGKLNADQTRRFHLMLARSIALGQRALGINREENNRAIVERYKQAERSHAELEPNDVRLLCEALIDLGDIDEARERTDALPDEFREVRVELYRGMVEKARSGPVPDDAMALMLITKLIGDPELPSDARVWAITRQVEILLAQGYADEAISKALRALPTMHDVDARARGELFGLLGRAYLKTGATDEARKQLVRAREMLGEEDPLVAEVLLALGKIEFNRDKVAAGELFEEVVTKFPDSSQSMGALLGLAEVHAWLGNSEGDLEVPIAEPEASHSEPADVQLDGGSVSTVAPSEGPLPHAQGEGHGSHGSDSPEPQGFRSHRDEAITRYAQLVERLRSGERHREVTTDVVGASIMSNTKDRYDAGDLDTALRYSMLAEQLFGTEEAPASVMYALAEINRDLGNRILGEKAKSSSEGVALTLAKADPATQAMAKRHFIEAGRYFRLHADKVVLTDNAGHGNSVWAAAQMYDRAGDLEEALRAFQDFVQGFPSDPRLPEATFHLAQTHLARGELDAAIRIYEELISKRGTSHAAGPFSDKSYVPLARALLSDSDPGNDVRAEEMLLVVLSGTVGGPSTPMYREALGEYADLCYRAKRFDEAVAKLDELIARYAQHSENEDERVEIGTETYFKLADAHRLAAKSIDASLAKGGMPDSDRKRLEDERAQHLRQGIEQFEQVRQMILAKPRRTKLDSIQLRNAHYYLGDCAFELGDYDGAIRHYDAARERYPTDPASLVAMTQIVNAHLRRGEIAKAITANERARRFFQSLPDVAWDDPSLPMGRSEWERWLDATTELAKGMLDEGATRRESNANAASGR